VNNVNLAVSGYIGSERRRWITCLAAARFVGSYSPETLETATRLRIDSSTVENFAAAGKTWSVLKSYMTRQDREKLRISVFTFCWPLLRDGQARPEVIAEIMHEAIAERVKMKDLTNRIAAECGKSIREQGPLISLNRLLSWFERSNLPYEKRQAGLAHLRDLRKLIEEVE